MDETRRSARGRDRTQRTRSARRRHRQRRYHGPTHPDGHTRARVRHHARGRSALRQTVGRRGMPPGRSCDRRCLARERRRPSVTPNQRLLSLEGPARSLLTVERTLLNFLQLLSGTATLGAHDMRIGCRTRRCACSIRAKRCRVCGSRRSTPFVAAAATTTGSDCSTHFSSRKTTSPPRDPSPPRSSTPVRSHPIARVEVEVENIEEFRTALIAGADIIMLDDFSEPDMHAGGRDQSRPGATRGFGRRDARDASMPLLRSRRRLRLHRRDHEACRADRLVDAIRN